MINEEYKTKTDNSDYVYKYYDSTDNKKYVIVKNGKIVKATTREFIDLVEKHCGFYKRKDCRVETNEDWKKITGETRGSIDCYSPGFTSLQGAPKEVRGNFVCYFCKNSKFRRSSTKSWRKFLV